MLMNFAMLPPEVNSARMYTGPGSTSMWAASVSWYEVSAGLHSAAETYGSVVTDLATWQWQGPTAGLMVAAVLPYIEWLRTTAAQAGQAAAQASAAAIAFEEAFAKTVPPPVVAANRAELASLIATNFFGQNTSAIAANDALYSEMWATDTGAMVNYGQASAAATVLTPFSSPQRVAIPAGLQAQSAGAANAATMVGVGANWLGTLVEELAMAIAPFVPELAAPLYAIGELINAIPFPSFLADDFTIMDGLLAFYATINSIQNITSMGTGLIGAEQNLGLLPDVGAAVAEAVPGELGPLPFAALGQAGALESGLGEVAAAFRGAGSIGQMSVPPTWAAPAVSTVKAFEATPMTTLPTVEAAAAGVPGFPGMPMTATGRGGVVPRYGVRLSVMSRPLSGG